MNSHELLQVALLRRSPLWQAAAARTRRFERGHSTDAADAVRLADDYRMLAHDVALARELIPGSRAREFLETAYAQAHATLNKPAWHPGNALLALLRDELPEVVRWLRPHIAWATTLFVLTGLCGYWLVQTYPQLIGLFAAPELIATVERGQLWTEGLLNIAPSAVLSLQILTNNILVSLFAYCAGFLFGLGTLYILGINGLMLGAVFAFTRLHGLAHALFGFVVAHGCVELSVMCLSGAAGAAVGEALIRPGTATRAEAFQIAALRSGKLVFICVLLLIGCGLIEGYVSPDPRFPLWSRILIGVGYWLFMLALLTGRAVPRRHTTRAA
ncbi:MAG TPA: stage II sporulation protein M [Steroidobacteraceae bacterium]